MTGELCAAVYGKGDGPRAQSPPRRVSASSLERTDVKVCRWVGEHPARQFHSTLRKMNRG